MSIVVSLLGVPQVIKDGKQLTFPYRKAEGLFYYLCVKRSVSRDEAIGIFWVDCAEGAARKNLRDAIYHLKKLLGEDIVLAKGNSRISLNREQITSLDYDELLPEDFFQHYSGEFLGYFYIKNCMEFEDWTTNMREELLNRFQSSVQLRLTKSRRSYNKQALIDCANALLHRQIFEEGMFQEILSILVEHDEHFEAEQIYQRLKQAMLSELGEAPEEKTARLLRQPACVAASSVSAGAAQPDAEEYFFGREQEMYALHKRLKELEHGGAACSVLLTGEAGVGKSTILRKLKNQLSPERYVVVNYQCVQTEEDLYLKPWNDMLTQVEDVCKANNIQFDAPLDFYSRQIDVPLFTTQYEIFAESLLQRLSEQLPGRKIVMLIDDVQWMDAASRRLLSNLLFWAGNRRLMMVLVCRDDYAGRLLSLKAPLAAKDLLREMTVFRFTLEETKEIISQRNPELLEQQAFLESIYHSTEGNALFLLEFLKELEHGGSASPFSPKTTGMIQSRLMDLGVEERDLLDSISLYPRLATVEELQVMAGQTKIQVLKNLERLLARQLICQTSTYHKQGYGFSHQLIRDYVYDNLLPDKRRVLHRLIAEYYEQQYSKSMQAMLCPMLIYHFDRCQDVYKTYTYRLEYLRAFYAVEHEIYPTLLAEQADPQVRPLGTEDELASLAEQIRILHQTSIEAAPLRMKAEFLLGRFELFSGQFDKGLENIQTSINLAKKLDDGKYLMENYLQMVFHAIQIHDLTLLGEYITSCEDLLKQGQYTQADTCTVLRLRGVYHMINFQYAKAEEIFHQVIAKIEALCRVEPSYRIGLAACYNYLGECKQGQGDLGQALEHYTQAITCCQGESMVSGMGVFYSNAGYVLYLQGDYALAQTYIDQANRCFAERGALWGRSKAHSYTALLAIARGDMEQARTHFHIAQEIARYGKNPSSLTLLSEVERLLAQ